MNFILWIVSPNGYPHSRCFEEVAQSLQESFSMLGHTAIILKRPPEFHYEELNVIILGANLLRSQVPNDWIVYNLEQITPESPWLTPQYIDLLRSHPVWDYSRNNIEALKSYNINAKLCEIGYSPCLTKIPAEDQDIDILHIGSMNDRRQHILDDLQSKLPENKVVLAFNCYGTARDRLIARSKIILNIHFYEAKNFEIVRCSYLMANRKAIVSEIGKDKQLEEPYYEGIAFDDYSSLSARCIALLDNDLARSQLETRGYEIFSSRSQHLFLKEVLA